jgi:hypothetical protein
MQLSPAARAVRERLFSDFEFYAQNALWILCLCAHNLKGGLKALLRTRIDNLVGFLHVLHCSLRKLTAFHLLKRSRSICRFCWKASLVVG